MNRTNDSLQRMRNVDRMVEMLIMAGCSRCGRRLWGDECPRGQMLDDRASPCEVKVVCDPCVAVMLGK